MTRPRRSLNWLSPLGIEPLLYLALAVTGLTGAALALFLGKLFAAAVLAAMCIGFYLRFKRGRVAKKGGESA